MTREKIIDAVTELDSDILNRYFAVKSSLTEKRKLKRNIFTGFACISAFFCFAVAISALSGQLSNVFLSVVIPYGPFIFVPVLIVSCVHLSIYFVKRETTLKALLIISAVLLVSVNILNIIAIYLYSQFGGINIVGSLPIILFGSNISAITSVTTTTFLIRKVKAWWIKLFLCFLAFCASIFISAMAYNLIIALTTSNTITLA